jgi:hypothetical protein
MLLDPTILVPDTTMLFASGSPVIVTVPLTDSSVNVDRDLTAKPNEKGELA